MSELLDILGCHYPIIQGPIGAMNSPKLVAAVCEAGAFGMLGLGFSKPEEAKRLAKDVRELTDKPFGANLMFINPANQEILEILAETGVKTITTSAGSPGNFYEEIHAFGIKGLHVLLTDQHTRKVEDSGVDGVGGNIKSLLKIYRFTERYWRRMLSSRSQKSYITWERFQFLKSIFTLQRPKIFIPYV